ncbi:MAG TPA: c-type cytochrome biogenesis protein CcmI [Pseudolabrys sp.]|nr:c-type cytochrome biogenesis protein CcmI [Pseudolabrys sp.]
MALWLILGLMTAVAVAAVLWPLSKPKRSPAGTDVEVYRDQLSEIERDQRNGLIAAPEAQAAKIEVSRRLIAAAEAAQGESEGHSIWGRRWVALASVVVLPIGALVIYGILGSPQMADHFSSERTVAGDRSITTMVAQVEAHLASNPDDGRGWEVLAPVYMRLGRFDDAVTAWRNAIRVNGATGSREAQFGQALVAAAGGSVTQQAKTAFERAVALDKQNLMARFYLGLAADQEGRRADANAIWSDLIASAPPGAPWVQAVREAMARSAQTSRSSGSSPRGSTAGETDSAPSIAAPSGSPAPTAADIAAASRMSEKDRDEMIRGMVARLADRLKEDGQDVEGWQRLLRAYIVLGEREKAHAAAGDARRALANDPSKLRRIEDMIKSLGLSG